MATGPEDARDDATLIALINEGDVAAFESLYRRHRDWVAHLATRMTGDESVALDVVQETFLYVLRKFPGFTLTCQFRSFLYPAVRNLAISARAKATRAQGVGEVELDAFEAPAGSWTPAGAHGRDRSALAAVLAGLPEAQREVVLLRFVDGLSLEEIGVALGVPLGTVKSRLHHALAALRTDDRIREYFEE